MFTLLVTVLLYAVQGQSANISNISNFNFTYYVSGDTTLYTFNSSMDMVQGSSVYGINRRNITNETVVFHENNTVILTAPLLGSVENTVAHYWYEIVPIADTGSTSPCVVAADVPAGTICEFTEYLHQYGNPVRFAEFWFVPFGPNSNGYHKGIRLTFFDDSVQWYGDIAGLPTNSYTFALGETLNTLQTVWVTMARWNYHCCESWGFLGCNKYCWTNPYVLGWVYWTTNLGVFGAGSPNTPYLTYNYEDVAGKMLAGMMIAPRLDGSDHESALYISGLNFYLFDNVVSVDILDVSYVGLDSYNQGLVPKGLVEWVVCNDGEGTITRTTTYEDKTGSSECFVDGQSTMFGVDATVTAGIPEIGFSVSESAKWEQTETTSHQKCQNTEQTLTTSTTAEFPGYSQSTIIITQYQSTIVIPYTATLHLETQDMGQQELITLQGQYTGIYVSNVYTKRTTINDSQCVDLGNSETDDVQQKIAFNNIIILFIFFIIAHVV